MNNTLKRNIIIAEILVFSILIWTVISPAGIYADSQNIQDEEAIQEVTQMINEAVETDDVVTDYIQTEDSAVLYNGDTAIVDIPKNPNEDIIISDGLDSTTKIGLPEMFTTNADAIVGDNGTVLYEDGDNDSKAELVVQALSDDSGFEGVRASILINDESAPHEYDFDLTIPSGGSVTTAKKYLGDDYDTGEIYVLDNQGELSLIFDAPWAKDANGKDLPTHYEVVGNTVKQIVEFDADTAFPVVADPTAWQVVKCVAAIGVVIVSTIFSAAKILKIKNYIKAIGGIKQAATNLIKSFSIKGKSGLTEATKAKIRKELGTSVLELFAAILGIDTIIANCRF